jgi:hypothetical protein
VVGRGRAWYVANPLSGWRLRSFWVTAAGAGALLISACGSGARQDANEPKGNFPVQVSAAKFPASQRLAEHTDLVISVRNSGRKTIPDIAVTLLDARQGTTAQAFGQSVGGTSQVLASNSRPIWIVDRPPGPCQYSCRQGGPGGAVTAYSNTWALGVLKPGQTVTFDWGVTAVKSGAFAIRYEIAAGLNGRAKAVDANGAQPAGIFQIEIHGAPQQAFVNDQGKVVTTP